jgi:hypothetical protein
VAGGPPARLAASARRIPFPFANGRAMKKIKLQVQELAVESFPISEVQGEAGTVHGEELKPTRMTFDCPCTPIV